MLFSYCYQLNTFYKSLIVESNPLQVPIIVPVLPLKSFRRWYTLNLAITVLTIKWRSVQVVWVWDAIAVPKTNLMDAPTLWSELRKENKHEDTHSSTSSSKLSIATRLQENHGESLSVSKTSKIRDTVCHSSLQAKVWLKMDADSTLFWVLDNVQRSLLALSEASQDANRNMRSFSKIIKSFEQKVQYSLMLPLQCSLSDIQNF